MLRHTDWLFREIRGILTLALSARALASAQDKEVTYELLELLKSRSLPFMTPLSELAHRVEE